MGNNGQCVLTGEESLVNSWFDVELIGETLCTVEHRDPNGSNEEIEINCGTGTVIYLAEGTF